MDGLAMDGHAGALGSAAGSRTPWPFQAVSILGRVAGIGLGGAEVSAWFWWCLGMLVIVLLPSGSVGGVHTEPVVLSFMWSPDSLGKVPSAIVRARPLPC